MPARAIDVERVSLSAPEVRERLEPMGLAGGRALYAAAIFWSALLLLLVQPIVTKAILPWFGGSAGVWTTSMLFYQVLLLGGYAYAHLLSRAVPFRAQIALHVLLLALSCAMLPLAPSAAWKPTNGQDPLPRILGLLATTVGLPYLLLSASSPLLQSWYTRALPIRFPYRLYAVSNLGSLIALVAYPFVVEPNWTTRMQLNRWSLGYGGFVLLCAAVGLMSWNRDTPARDEAVEAPDRPRRLLWFALSACASVLWLAVANHLSQDVAAVPFLWVLPLGVYLLSFVLCFDSDGWYRPKLYRFLLPLAWVAIVAGVSQQGYIGVRWMVALFGTSLFLCCMFCHGELAKLRPSAHHLTSYYLTLAGGGAVGGVFVALIAPRVFTEYLELPLGLLGCIVLALLLLYNFAAGRVLRIGGTALAAVLVAIQMRGDNARKVNVRNFYGTLQVTEQGTTETAVRVLYNGTIQHGVQFVSPLRSRIPTTYYGPASGAAIALEALRSGPQRVGVVGLGVGTLATYSKPGDTYRFYEINPLVIHLAGTQFHYLQEAAGKIDVVAGDARLSLEREQPQNFDILAVDAFSGDSIPVHLMTREAFDLYFRHLKPGGALVMHVTNKHLDLAPIVKRIADASGKRALLIHNSLERERKIEFSSWVIVTGNQELANRLSYLSSSIRGNGRVPLWTDDYSNLFSTLK